MSLQGIFGRLYGLDVYSYLSKNGFDRTGKFIRASNDKTGADESYGRVRIYNKANSKQFIFTPVSTGPLKMWGASSLPQALRMVHWGKIRKIIIGRDKGVWNFYVQAYNILTPSMANKFGLKLDNYLSLAVDSRMEPEKLFNEHSWPRFVATETVDPSQFIQSFGAQLRQRGWGRAAVEVREMAAAMDEDAEFATAVDDYELGEALDDYEFGEGLDSYERRETLGSDHVSPPGPLMPSVHVKKRHYVDEEQAGPSSKVYVKESRKRHWVPGPTAVDDPEQRHKRLKQELFQSFKSRQQQRLEIVNYHRGLDPHDFIYA